MQRFFYSTYSFLTHLLYVNSKEMVKILYLKQRMLKMMTIADNKHFSYQNRNDLIDFIASEMQKEGFGPNNEENIDSYLNTKFM